MATISLRVDEREKRLFRKYARMNHMSVSQLLRTAAIERIENEFDLELFDKALAKRKDTHTMAEVKKDLSLD